MKVGSSDDCGSSNIKVEIIQGGRFCITKESGTFYKGGSVKWSNDDLGTCKDFKLMTDETIYHRYRLNSMDDFCPLKFYVTLADKADMYAAPTNNYFFRSSSDYIGQNIELEKSNALAIMLST